MSSGSSTCKIGSVLYSKYPRVLGLREIRLRLYIKHREHAKVTYTLLALLASLRKPVSQILLVERRLVLADLHRRGPETRAVRGPIIDIQSLAFQESRFFGVDVGETCSGLE